MAASQSKRSIRTKSTTLNRRVFDFPEAKGKLLKGVEFSAEPNYQSITLNFEDRTCLDLVIKPGFTLKAEYSDWKTDRQQILKRWRPIRRY